MTDKSKKVQRWLCQVDANMQPRRWVAWTAILAKRKDCFPVKNYGDSPDVATSLEDGADPTVLAALEGEVGKLNEMLVEEQDRADKLDAALTKANAELNDVLKELQDVRNIVAELEDSLNKAVEEEPNASTTKTPAKPAAKPAAKKTAAAK